jgi:hypothetical protein
MNIATARYTYNSLNDGCRLIANVALGDPADLYTILNEQDVSSSGLLGQSSILDLIRTGERGFSLHYGSFRYPENGTLTNVYLASRVATGLRGPPHSSLEFGVVSRRLLNRIGESIPPDLRELFDKLMAHGGYKEV